jgi:hypothetical protein
MSENKPHKYDGEIDPWQTNLAKFSTVVRQNSAISELMKLNSDFFPEGCTLATFCLAQKVW